MVSAFNRRSFLKAASASALGLGLAGYALPSAAAAGAEGAGAGGAASGQPPLYKISLAEWSLHRTIFGGELDHLDFAAAARQDFGVEAVEYVNQFFMDKAKDKEYLRQMKQRAEDAGVESLLIMIDGEGYLGDPYEKERQWAVESHYKWIEAAEFLGCHSIRVNAESAGTYEEQRKRAADGLRSLCEFATDYDINVLVENHGGFSSNGEWLASVMERVDHPLAGTLPDFGNFEIVPGKRYDRYKGVRELMPYAGAVSAKAHVFDDDGQETRTEYERMMQIVLDHDYHDYVGIEYEGDELSEPEGIRATKTLLERTRTQLAEKKG